MELAYKRCQKLHSLFALCIAAAVLSGCLGGGAHYLTVTTHIGTRALKLRQLPEPEVVFSPDLASKRAGLKRISIFFILNERETETHKEFLSRPEIGEFKRSFINGGFKVLEVRPFTPTELERFATDEKAFAADISPSSDGIVVVYDLDPNKAALVRVEADHSTSFAYGPSFEETKLMAKREIEAEIGVDDSMTEPFGDVSKTNTEHSENVTEKILVAFLEAKLIETATGEALLLYKGYTMLIPGPAKKNETYAVDVGQYKYDEDKRKFVAIKRKKNKAPRYNKTPYDQGAYLRHIAKACVQFVDTITKNQQIVTPKPEVEPL